MKTWQKTAGVAALLVLSNVAPAFAETFEAVPIMAPISAPSAAAGGTQHYLPARITVLDKELQLDQAPVILNETLYIPLRAIAEAAGGTVTWDGATQTVSVDLPDRTATFVIGQDEAEMNQRGVFYIRRNMIKMAGTVQLIGGRTMIPVDATWNILGLEERADEDLSLDLIPIQKPEAPATGKVIPGSQQVAAVAVERTALSVEQVTWADEMLSAEPATFKLFPVADGVIVGIAGGLQSSGGYTIELLGGGARLVDGTWYVDAKLVPPAEMASMAMTNPVAFFHLPGVSGNVEVNFWTNGATP